MKKRGSKDEESTRSMERSAKTSTDAEETTKGARMMERDKHILILNDYEQRVIVNCLKSCRDESETRGISESEMDQLILKVIDAPVKKGRRIDHDAR